MELKRSRDGGEKNPGRMQLGGGEKFVGKLGGRREEGKRSRGWISCIRSYVYHGAVRAVFETISSPFFRHPPPLPRSSLRSSWPPIDPRYNPRRKTDHLSTWINFRGKRNGSSSSGKLLPRDPILIITILIASRQWPNLSDVVY